MTTGLQGAKGERPAIVSSIVLQSINRLTIQLHIDIGNAIWTSSKLPSSSIQLGHGVTTGR
jgi:hypothetical protein